MAIIKYPRTRHITGSRLQKGDAGAAMREIQILLAPSHKRHFTESINNAIASSGLRVTLFGSLRKYTGSVHWHVKRGRESGTLEITCCPKEHRAWFTIQSGREAAWIDEAIAQILEALHRAKEA